MKKMEAGEGARDTLSFCVCYFGEFLQVMAEEERWDDIIRIGSYIKMPEFQRKLLSGL